MAGEIINYSNIVTYGKWSDSYSLSGNITFYVASPGFGVTHTTQGSGWWGAENGHLQVWYWNGSSWVSCYVYNHPEVRGSGNSDTVTWYHNAYGSGSSSGDNHDVHLYKVQGYSHGDGSSSTSLLLYSIGYMSETQYNNFFKGKIIRSSRGSYTTSSTYENGNTFDNEYGHGFLRGMPVMTSRAKYLCS